ncbi:MAG: rod shape-determining protein [Prevotellaceae bacterium]|jgi:rod shape-determining protein MreB|nr:rod shape-determining protein [Prevotellaceae bacterium]
MGKIFFKKSLAIELGAERMLVVENDKIVLNEPTVIAVDKSQKRTRYAVGNAALKLEGQRTSAQRIFRRSRCEYCI